jgi:putative restriction endonuclease
MEQSRPLIYFFGLVPGRYLPFWPAYIVGDRPGDLTFEVAIEDMEAVKLGVTEQNALAEPRRIYMTSLARTRLHQRSFRERVIEAYQTTCSLCRLRHRELLDAAHIIPDIEERGIPSVSNGISLCKLHHAAFDSFMIGISPDYKVQVREDILQEQDGPMLLHGLQGLHGASISLPARGADWPDRDALDWSYQRFLGTA